MQLLIVAVIFAFFVRSLPSRARRGAAWVSPSAVVSNPLWSFIAVQGY
jgi:hypothetical protein